MQPHKLYGHYGIEGTYILLCEHNKYYVGFTRNLLRRMEEHFSIDNKTQWTSLHKPIKLIAFFPRLSEKIVTLLCIYRFGFDNVAGYNWCAAKTRAAFRRRLQPRYLNNPHPSRPCTSGTRRNMSSSHLGLDCAESRTLQIDIPASCAFHLPSQR